jgi:hypothetical protein
MPAFAIGWRVKLFRLAILLAPLLLAACASGPQQRADDASVQASGVSPAVYDGLVQREDLSLSDIKALARARVGDGIVLRYLKERRTVYHLGGSQVAGLRRAGVSPSVIDYLVHTPATYAADSYNYGPYTQNPFYPFFGPGGGGGGPR